MVSLLHAAPPLRHDAGAEDAIRAAVQVLRLTQKDLVQWHSAKDYTPPRRFEAEGWLVAPETVTALECSDRGVDFVLAIIGGNIYRDLFEQLPAKGVGEVEEAVLYVRFADGRVVELRDLPVVDSLVNVVRRRGKA
jgi:hypothetical protein